VLPVIVRLTHLLLVFVLFVGVTEERVVAAASAVDEPEGDRLT
jgi:hypothetical protein